MTRERQRWLKNNNKTHLLGIYLFIYLFNSSSLKIRCFISVKLDIPTGIGCIKIRKNLNQKASPKASFLVNMHQHERLSFHPIQLQCV